ncbi:Protein FAM136A [Amphibalanus amphitrite]|uniref:Protein FAM136A n=1 Tax=Amphibalanus amphitrite TaxID=1232801 RepID=A0A6A4WWR8_AMPAM|nr:protein FAM136A-like [Amphibalanus amphitrite]XP_043216813.1 protein FAM136A-like [Amphibalanus amphitrite]XP_043216814.1 protein FAM136A-like [Amphibalanus amphitrite]XP_043216815.1 protein FAM136A-like [Amphibalanus amphitrite]XP_043217835.1 protein FAM136A-like [Amphibalanus amphitrite]XP_043217836.1 protein FAM136A-like [Amphibalanus amphitrite]XP_043217837.1 protein FAM136A-like [Amphibalanus amphitrite]KAF0308304.1 Protein FAM136A [Amphibalanus amphitrite]
MAEAAQERVQTSMTSMVDDIDKSYLRKMQGDMHRCAARCCDDPSSSIDKVHGCIEQCSIPLQKAQHFVQTQMSDIQERLQRCVMQCQDKIKDKVGPNTTEAEVQGYKVEFEECAVKCVDDSIATFPNHARRIKDHLHKRAF